MNDIQKVRDILEKSKMRSVGDIIDSVSLKGFPMYCLSELELNCLINAALAAQQKRSEMYKEKFGVTI